MGVAGERSAEEGGPSTQTALSSCSGGRGGSMCTLPGRLPPPPVSFGPQPGLGASALGFSVSPVWSGDS